MPVPTEKIKERIKLLHPTLNLSKERMDAIAARLAKKPADNAEDTAVDAVINDANDFMPFADIAREDDRLRNLEAKAKDSEKTPEQIAAETAAKKKADEDAEKAKEELNKAPDWFKSFASSVENKMESLNKELSTIKTGSVVDKKKQTVLELFSKSDVLKSLKDSQKNLFMKLVDLDSETPVEEQIAAIETEYSGLVQANANEQDYSANPPNGTPANKPTEKEIEDLVDQIS